jgi:hypothetical protein
MKQVRLLEKMGQSELAIPVNVGEGGEFYFEK